jgi:DnaJ-class molecular chaperone
MTESRWDPYEELGIGQSASLEEIKWAFRSKARESHPDKVCVLLRDLTLHQPLSVWSAFSPQLALLQRSHFLSSCLCVSVSLSHTLLPVWLSACPLVCQVIHDDQGEKFRRVRHAYELLTDSDARARYDAGLRACARTHSHTHTHTHTHRRTHARTHTRVSTDPNVNTNCAAGKFVEERHNATIIEVDLGISLVCGSHTHTTQTHRHRHRHRHTNTISSSLFFSLSLSLSLLRADDMESSLDDETETYSHTCRCSGSFVITADQLSEVCVCVCVHVCVCVRARASVCARD